MEAKLGYKLNFASPQYACKKYYVPPISPHHLIQEILFYDPWKLLVMCIVIGLHSSELMYSLAAHPYKLKKCLESGCGFL